MRRMGIDDWRERIDAIDAEILQLLNRRARLAMKVGDLKWREGLPLHVPGREREVLSRMWKLNDGPLNGRAVARLFRLIIRETRRVQATRLRSRISPFPPIRLRANSRPAKGRSAPVEARAKEAAR